MVSDFQLAFDIPEIGGAIGLRDEFGVLVDSVSYQTLAGPNQLTEGTPAAHPPTVAPPGRTIGRLPNLIDTNRNSADFAVRFSPTPRQANQQP